MGPGVSSKGSAGFVFIDRVLISESVMPIWG